MIGVAAWIVFGSGTVSFSAMTFISMLFSRKRGKGVRP